VARLSLANRSAKATIRVVGGVGRPDVGRLVLLNLVGNAVKFTETGEVSITTGARNGHFAVSVTDTGPGMPLDQQDLIFEQFHQVDSSNTKAKAGTGLGLAIGKQIVEVHGGRIWVESTLGKGSTFQMELPVRAQDAGTTVEDQDLCGVLRDDIRRLLPL
jgi:signal transduction histidine kinase